ncbi:hypothetical protein [secondary endosymbiont of Ctenarytaina eucalypti]|uniref:hypothetical protein n=1 Tax=secondary endosymbiont of Ctenarytaina eucalypti TaxID=1199245 RepID=UPI0002D5C07A|nr:hypothetical protein [secondary endosymbiont of Ctenarytaina eucalypti]
MLYHAGGSAASPGRLVAICAAARVVGHQDLVSTRRQRPLYIAKKDQSFSSG